MTASEGVDGRPHSRARRRARLGDANVLGVNIAANLVDADTFAHPGTPSAFAGEFRQ